MNTEVLVLNYFNLSALISVLPKICLQMIWKSGKLFARHIAKFNCRIHKDCYKEYEVLLIKNKYLAYIFIIIQKNSEKRLEK